MFFVYFFIIIIIILFINNFLLLYHLDSIKNNYINKNYINDDIDLLTYTIFISKNNKNYDIIKNDIEKNLYNYEDVFILKNNNNIIYDKLNQSTLLNINNVK